MKKYLMLIGMLSLMVTGCGGADKASADEPEVIEAVKSVEAYGVVQVKDKENIAIEVPGRITDVRVLNGQAVIKGEVLFVLDIEDYLNGLDQKRQTLAMREQELALMMNADDDEVSSHEEALVKQNEAKKLELTSLTNRYDRLKSSLSNGSDEDLQIALLNRNGMEKVSKDASEVLAKSQSLYEQGIIAQSEYDEMRQRVDSAKLNYDTSIMTYKTLNKQKEEEMASLQVQIKYVSSELDQLSGQTEQSAVDYDLKKLELDMLKEEIKGMEDNLNPDIINDKGEVICHMEHGIFDGFDYTRGDMLSGDPSVTVFVLNNAEALEVYAKVSEDFIKDLYVGQTAQVIPVASREAVIQGVITAISAIAYQEGGEAVIPVWISVDDPEGFMKANYSVDVEFVLDSMQEIQ